MLVVILTGLLPKSKAARVGSRSSRVWRNATDHVSPRLSSHVTKPIRLSERCTT
jgi:hypothetical protein